MQDNQPLNELLANQLGKVLVVNMDAVKDFEEDFNLAKWEQLLKEQKIQLIDLSPQAKPVLLIEVDNQSLQTEQFQNIKNFLEGKFDDYHVLVLPLYMNRSASLVKIQAFYPSDFGKVDIDTLKKIVDDAIRSNTTGDKG